MKGKDIIVSIQYKAEAEAEDEITLYDKLGFSVAKRY